MVISRITEKGYEFGFNAATGTFENLIESGVIDPVKVVRVALENASSVAGTVLLTDCVVIDEEKVKPPTSTFMA
jgi:chaperonin GroEL